MKVPVFSSLILALGLSSPLLGIERPKSLDQNETPNRERAPRAVEVDPEPEAIPRAIPAAEESPAWLGVFSEPIDETLSSHLGVDGGVVLRFVADESPAAAAGLKEHDVVTAVDGTPVRGQEALRDVILAHEPGEEVELSVVSRGEKVDKMVKLTERPADLPRLPRNGLQMPNLPPQAGDVRLPELRERLRELENLFPNGAGDLQRQLENQMQKMEKHLEQMENLPELGLNLDLKDMLEDLPREGKDFKFDLKFGGSMKLMDEDGSVEMKMRNGGREVEVRDKQGNLLYEGPWDNEQDKAAVPPQMRERIERLNLNGKGDALQFRLDQDVDPLDEPGDLDLDDPDAAPDPKAGELE